jgi:hypothetical protein
MIMHNDTVEALIQKVFGYPNKVETAENGGDWEPEMNMTGIAAYTVVNIQQMFEYELGIATRIVWEK